MMTKTSLPPGFRFHPTDVELVWYYLKRKTMGKPFRFEAISEVELYKFAPWDLPGKSCLRSRDLEWFFFCPRDRKYSQGSRTNRATDIGYWKTTGRDRTVVHNSHIVGMKKTLIFHLGKAPQGSRTDWVMYEFRLESKELVAAGYAQDAYVLCKIFQKSGPGPKNGEQYGAPFKEEDWEEDADIDDTGFFPSISASEHARSFDPVPPPCVGPEVGGPSSVPSNFGEPSSVVSNFEVGEPSSVVSNFEVGEPSSVPELAGVGKLSFMQDFSEVGEPYYVPESSFADGISLEQLEEFLNSSPSQSRNDNNEMFNSATLHDDVTPLSDLDFENIYGNLLDLSVQPYPGPTDGFVSSDTLGFDPASHPAFAEFANEHYVELSDIDFVDEGNPDKLVALGDNCCPLSNNIICNDPGVIYPESVVHTCMASESQLTGCADDQFLSPLEDHRLQ